MFDCHGRKSASTANCCCLTCCYVAVPSADPETVPHGHHDKTAPDTNNGAVPRVQRTTCEPPPSEAAAFVASASAAVLVLTAALLAMVLSFAAVLTVASLVPMADAATDYPSHVQQRAADHLHRWHQQQTAANHQWDTVHRVQGQRRQRQYGGAEDLALRPKRQLLRKNADREPGIVALTFSLIGGTVSDVRQAYRNVSDIVRDTIGEVAKIQEPASTNATATAAVAAADGDQMMMAAGNSVENEIGGASSAAPPVNQQVAGQALGKLLGRNYRGLRRLFNSELRSAIKNSPGNVRDFAAELMGSIGQSFRPSNIFTRGPINAKSTTSTKR